MYTSVLENQSSSLSIGFPFALSVTVLFIITMMLNPEYILSRLHIAWKVIDKEEKAKEEEGIAAWKSGLIHYGIGGFIIPTLFALFSTYLTKNLYLKFIILMLRYLGFNVDFSSLSYYSSQTDIVLFIMNMLFTYVGIWIGVMFSILFLRFFAIGSKYKVIIWSTVYMVVAAWIAYYINEKTRTSDISYFDFNFFDHILRIVLFYVISKKYFYTLAKELERLKYYF